MPADPVFSTHFAATLSPGIRSFIGVPVLLSDDTLYGTLCAVDPEPSSLTRQQADLLVVLARLLATQIEREQAEARATILQDIAAALSEARTVEEVAEVILNRGLDALGAHVGAVCLLDDKRGEFSTVRLAGYSDELQQLWATFSADARVPIADAVRTGQVLVHETEEEFYASYPHLREARSTDGALASIPLLAHGRAVGGIGLGFKGRRTFSGQEYAFLQTLAGLCAQAMERSRLYDSEREARAESQAALRMRDEFILAIGHDLGTPLTAVKGLAQLVQRRLGREGPSSEPAALGKLVARIVQSADRLDSLVRDLLDVTRLRAGQPIELHYSRTDLVALCRRLAGEYRDTSEQPLVRLEAAEPELYCTCDGVRLERVISNLVGNAIKYSQPDSYRVTLSVGPDPATEGRALLSVRDEGIGIPEEELEKVFQLYYRASNVPASSSGSGIGLAGSRQILEQHGGTLAIESVVGKGTTVTVRLPCG